jgi:hypothetical protein
MSLVRLICWKEDLARERAALLRAARLDVDASPLNTSGLIGRIMENPPSAIVIDLDRMPSHGRVVGVTLRRSAAARRIPLVFAGGAEEKVARIRQELPDAIFTPWSAIAPSVRRAVKSAPAEPVKPGPLMDRYRSTGLGGKLGLKAGVACALLQAPEGFAEGIADLPEDFEFQPKIAAATDLAIWFVRTRAEMEFAVDRASLRMPQGASLWIVYPKQSGRLPADFALPDVRAAALAAGMVDYKICAVDDDWTGLKFARRKK